MPIGHQRYFCPECQQTFSESFDMLYDYRHISRVTKLAYNTVVSLVRCSSTKAQLVHNHRVEQVDSEAVSGDEMWSFVQNNKSSASWQNEKWAIVGLLSV